MAAILVIDDERSIRNSIKEILEFEGYEVELAENGKDGLDKIKNNKYDVVFCDIKMPEVDGLELLNIVVEEQPGLPIIMISGHGTIEVAVEAVKKGAYDFIAKPLDLNRILVAVRNALDKSSLVQETKRLRNKISEKSRMIGESVALQQIRDMIAKVAPTDARVLITGANGSGKELVAQAIHEQSQRSAMPFVEVNCAAIPSELIESELFGHEKGAFTSAIKQRKGKFEQADGGTLFLDEIGDMSLSAQAKVLRALQEHKITRVGSDKDVNVNVRVIAATNKDLQAEIRNNTFREDLYHRLSVILIKVPCLDERKDDIPLLIDAFIKQICSEMGMAEKKIDTKAVELLQQKSWTGNIRELRNVVERLIILGNSPITVDDVQRYVTM